MKKQKNDRYSLFIGDLSSDSSESDLVALFSPFGEVQSIKIMRTRTQANSLGYGFIKYSSPLSAHAAKMALDGFMFHGRKLRVRDAVYGVGGQTGGQHSVLSLYIRFECLTPEASTNEERIRDLFSSYGEISDVSIRKTFMDKVRVIVESRASGL